MKLMVIILNKTDALEYLLEGLSASGIRGATIIDSSGMAETLSKKTIISVIKNDQLEAARKVVYSTVGDLSQPNTGILFTIPIDFVEGTIKRPRPVALPDK